MEAQVFTLTFVADSMRATLTAVLLLALAAPAASAHPERHAFFPDGRTGAVPQLRSTADQVLIVCKKDSARRIKRAFRGHPRLKAKRLRQLRRCHFRNIQAAVNRARNGAIIRIMPGVYRELPSRRAPQPDPRCKDDYDTIGSSLLASGIPGSGGGAPVADFEYQRNCPNAQNLFAIIGDAQDAD